MSITVAKTAGFCFGVNNAVKSAFEIAKKGNPGHKIYTFGPLIHNKNVVQKLVEAGVETIETPEEASEGDIVIIRAHGTTPEMISRLESRGVTVVDATCPFVKKIHMAVKEEYEKGRQIIIIGDSTHPEIIGINGWCNNSAVIIDSEDDLEGKFDNSLKYTVVVQTTFNEEIYRKIAQKLKFLLDEIKFYDSICNATSMRQAEAREIASKSDLMIVIGSRESSNTMKLYDICKELCPNVFLVENASDIDVSRCYFYRIGVTAGASTPSWLIEEVLVIMDEVKSIENEVVTDETQAAEVVESFGAMLENSITTIKSGDIVEKPIIKVDASRVYLDLGFKYEGYVDINEFHGVEPQIGDMVKAFVVHVSDRDCEVKLSKSKIDKSADVIALEAAYNNKTIVTLKITSALEKGGLFAEYGTAKVYIPVNQISDRFVKEPANEVGKTVEAYITRFGTDERGRAKISASVKQVILERKNAADEAFWSKIELGKEYPGKVKGFTKNGQSAFVELEPGYDGFLPIREACWTRTNDIQSILSKGQEITVKVIKFNREENKITLSTKKPEDDPWFDAENKYPVGAILDVTISKFAQTKDGKNYGVFVEVTPDVTALVHISHISNKHINSAEECLQLGQTVQAKVLSIDTAEKKLSLGIKEVQAYDPAPKAEELDENGNPIVKEKKERAPRKERAPKAEGEVKERKPRAPKAPKEEEFHDNITPSGTSMADLVGDLGLDFSEEN